MYKKAKDKATTRKICKQLFFLAEKFNFFFFENFDLFHSLFCISESKMKEAKWQRVMLI